MQAASLELRSSLWCYWMFLLLLCACDPGFEYRPVDWPTAKEDFVWEKDFSGFKIKISHLAGFWGSQYVMPEFEVTNLSTLPIFLERAELRLGAKTLDGRLPGFGAKQWRTVAPGTSRRISVIWQFEQPTTEVLGKHPFITLTFHVGEVPVPVNILYARGQ